MKTDVLREISRIIIPFIQMFGIYVVVCGHLSPGGGFSGGSIIGASFVLYRYVYGKDEADRILRPRLLLRMACLACVAYGLLKGSLFVLDHLHLEVFHLTGEPGSILSGGFILPLNILVGIVVSIVFYFFVCMFEEGDIDVNIGG